MAQFIVDYLPLILAVVSGLFTIGGIVVSYFLGRKKSNAEVAKLEGEKKSVEAAAGLSTAEAASIIAQAAADVVQPLTNRIRELQTEAKAMADRHAEDKRLLIERQSRLEKHLAEVTKENVDLKTKVAHLEAQIALLSKPSELAQETSKRLGEY